MSWSIGFDHRWMRDIGYGVPAVCDFPGCKDQIDRGLSYVCGRDPYGGERGCGLFFCGKHLNHEGLCVRCAHKRQPFNPKPDVKEWVQHKMTDPSWADWRAEMGFATSRPIDVSEPDEKAAYPQTRQDIGGRAGARPASVAKPVTQ